MLDSFEIPAPGKDLKENALKVRRASIKNCQSTNNERKNALEEMSKALIENANEILEANEIDFRNAQNQGISKSLLSRLKLSNQKLLEGIKGIRQVSKLNDPIGQIQIKRELSKDLFLERKTVPIGVLGVIFESRPDAVMQIASLAVRSGNGVILKGGSEANKTNIAIVNALKKGLELSSIDKDSLCLLTSRRDSMAMLNLV